MFTEVDAGKDDRVGGDPAFVADDHVFALRVDGNVHEVVVGGDDGDSVGDLYAFSDINLCVHCLVVVADLEKDIHFIRVKNDVFPVCDLHPEIHREGYSPVDADDLLDKEISHDVAPAVAVAAGKVAALEVGFVIEDMTDQAGESAFN